MESVIIIKPHRIRSIKCLSVLLLPMSRGLYICRLCICVLGVHIGKNCKTRLNRDSYKPLVSRAVIPKKRKKNNNFAKYPMICLRYAMHLKSRHFLMVAVDAQNLKSSCTLSTGWLGGRVVSVLNSGAEGPGVQIAVATLSGNSLRQTVRSHCASAHQAGKLVAALLKVAGGNCRPGKK